MAARFSTSESESANSSDCLPATHAQHITHPPHTKFPREYREPGTGLFYCGYPYCPRTFRSRGHLHHHCQLHHSLIFDGYNWVPMHKELHEAFRINLQASNKKRKSRRHRHHHHGRQTLLTPAPVVLAIQVIPIPPPLPPVPVIRGRRTRTQATSVSVHTQTEADTQTFAVSPTRPPPSTYARPRQTNTTPLNIPNLPTIPLIFTHPFDNPDSTPGFATSFVMPPTTTRFIPIEWTYPWDTSTFPATRIHPPPSFMQFGAGELRRPY